MSCHVRCQIARRRIPITTIQVLTAISWIPVLYFPLAAIGLLLVAAGCTMEWEETAQLGLQLTTPAIVVVLVVAALLAFSGILNVIIYLVRCVWPAALARGVEKEGQAG